MNIKEQKFHDEIEVERLWVTTEQGEYVVFTMLPISLLMIFGLWDTSKHTLLLGWFALLIVVNLFRWRVLHFYRADKDALIANISNFKRLMLLGSALTGLCWVMGMVWFLQPSEPSNVLIISVALMIQIEGAVATWYCYLPAVIAISIPPTLLLIVQIFLQSDKIHIATALILSLMAISIFSTSIKLAKILNHALRLNFENAALRQESEEKSMLLETALENMAQGISMTDKDNGLRMWNRQFADMLGATGALIEDNADLDAIFVKNHAKLSQVPGKNVIEN
jgi:PAS domain-containing protein